MEANARGLGCGMGGSFGGASSLPELTLKRHFGNFAATFERNGWPEQRSDVMRKVQTRVVESYSPDAHLQPL